MTASELFDIRSNLWRESFKNALPYAEYVATGTPGQQEKWQAYRKRFSLTPDQRKLTAQFKRDLNVLVLSGMWCGDCARQCPMIDVIATAAPTFNVRFIDNQAIPQLRDEVRIHGAARVPVAVSLSEDFFEVGRSGDRQLAAYQRKAQTELGAACDAGIVPPSSEELAVELNQWVEHFERLQLLLRVSPFLRRRHND
jgi:thiol-disulfide isomerase/thioredoxin